jgi:hypothetical protein
MLNALPWVLKYFLHNLQVGNNAFTDKVFHLGIYKSLTTNTCNVIHLYIFQGDPKFRWGTHRVPHLFVSLSLSYRKSPNLY